MRKSLQFGILATVVLLLGGVGFLVGRSLWQQRVRQATPVGLEFLPGVSQRIRDFHRVKLQDGHKVWEISADDAQYFQEDNLVVVRNATLELQLRDGRTIGLKGDEARIELAGQDVSRVELKGAIQVTASDYVVRTNHAIYEAAQRVISIPDSVDISSRTMQLRGDSMEVAVDTEIVKLARNVSMHLEPSMLREGETNAPL